jgi:hypothetical protein
MSGPTMSPKLTNKTIGGSQKKQIAANTKIPSAMMSPVKKPDIGVASDAADGNSRSVNCSADAVALVCFNCRAATADKKNAADKNAKTAKPIAIPPTEGRPPTLAMCPFRHRLGARGVGHLLIGAVGKDSMQSERHRLRDML